jgi:hypothetical protein
MMGYEGMDKLSINFSALVSPAEFPSMAIDQKTSSNPGGA